MKTTSNSSCWTAPTRSEDCRRPAARSAMAQLRRRISCALCPRPHDRRTRPHGKARRLQRIPPGPVRQYRHPDAPMDPLDALARDGVALDPHLEIRSQHTVMGYPMTGLAPTSVASGTAWGGFIPSGVCRTSPSPNRRKGGQGPENPRRAFPSIRCTRKKRRKTRDRRSRRTNGPVAGERHHQSKG